MDLALRAMQQIDMRPWTDRAQKVGYVAKKVISVTLALKELKADMEKPDLRGPDDDDDESTRPSDKGARGSEEDWKGSEVEGGEEPYESWPGYDEEGDQAWLAQRGKKGMKQSDNEDDVKAYAMMQKEHLSDCGHISNPCVNRFVAPNA